MSQPPPSGGPYAPPAVPRPGGGAFSSAAPSPGAFDSSSYSRATSTDPGMLTQGGPGTPVDGAVGAGGGGQSEDDQLPDSGAATPTLQTDFEDGNNSSSTPAPSAQPAKRSKALNFLKKKETKVNVKGTNYKIVDDEIILEDDPRGEAKIDDNGILLGGRQWKVHTFTSPMRTNTEKLYMLSIDAARCAGFRDSLYFFRRNPLIHKLSCSQAEKDRLIELGKLSGNLKSRAVTMVSARNVFKVMGATFVQNGKYILDDYYEGKSLAAGHKAGEPAFIEPYDPEKDTGTLAVSKGNAPPGATSLGLNVLIGHPGKQKMPGSELISSQIGGGLHATFGGNGLAPFDKSSDPSAKKAKPALHLTVEDWMYEYAKEVGQHNRRYASVRASHVGQVSISLGVDEREEDCWEMVEEEYTDDEPSSATAAAGDVKPPLAHSSASTSMYPQQLAQLPQVQSQPDPSLPPVSGVAVPSSAPGSAVLPPPPVARPKKKRWTKRFNPIRGFYELETNVPHVYRSTQPTAVLDVYRQDARARIFARDEPDGVEGTTTTTRGKEQDKGKRKRKQGRNAVNGGGPGLDGEGEGDRTTTAKRNETERERRRLETVAASHGGVASIEFVSHDASWDLEDPSAREPLLPGMWDFGAGPRTLEQIALDAEEDAKARQDD